MARLIRHSLECLARCHERDLYFIPGRRLAEFRYLLEERLRSKSTAARYRRLAHFVLKRMRLRSSPREPVDFLLYAVTSNEYVALAPIARVLSERGYNVCMLCNKQRSRDGGEAVPPPTIERYGVRAVAAGMVLLCRRAPALARELRRTGGREAPRAFLPAFCRVYFYLPYFLDLLTNTRPRNVIVANDHNPEITCLTTAADRLGVGTVYVQHAAVTSLFPPLSVDLAFLDGLESARAYAGAARDAHHPGSTRVFLSGQKKPLEPARECARTKLGVAINRMDALDDVVGFVGRLVDHGNEVLLRPHPGQARSFHRRLAAAFAEVAEVELSHPEREPIGHFLGRCRLLIAGHSSIHLEAALAGVASYFVDLSGSPRPDFYGFLQSGLVEPLPASFWQGGPAATQTLERLAPSRVEALGQYSATYGTRWQGREAELVATTLERIERAEGLEELYQALPAEAGFERLWTVRA